MKKKILPRLKEKNTWAGLATLASMFGLISVGEIVTVTNAGAALVLGISGLYNVIAKEKDHGKEESHEAEGGLEG
ncbi:hypothetical protein [Endozoicomonas arenosclerae]|uniref:hypothetical protein n=1 Tax=Endozoicomonas arenosclerae TaxID=1633495 RepID=UPI0007850BA6|nr:hypothetical protein [Endozoicomonas arenosclerae]